MVLMSFLAGPSELTVLSIDAISKVHGALSKCTKKHTGLYDVFSYKGMKNLDGITEPREHRDRRRIWDKAMTKQCTSISYHTHNPKPH